MSTGNNSLYVNGIVLPRFNRFETNGTDRYGGIDSTSNNFDVFGPHSYWYAAGASFLVGCWLGERAVFAILGGVVTYFFMRGNQGEV